MVDAISDLARTVKKTRSRLNRRGIMAGPNEREQMDTSARLRDRVWTENSTLPSAAHLREERRMRSLPNTSRLALAKLRNPQSGPFISDHPGDEKRGVPNSCVCAFISSRWL